MFGLGTALRMIWHSFSYRLRMREANNLLVTISMMLAFGLPWGEMLYRTAYALVLNIYVYLINDYCDIEADLSSPHRESVNVRYMAEHRREARGALIGLGAALLVGALVHSRLLLAAFFANTAIITAYSAWLKRLPIVDLLLMGLAGGSMTLVGLPERPTGWPLIGLLCLVSASYQTIQVIRDEPADRASGVQTTAVRLGVRRSAWIFRGLVVAAALYGPCLLRMPITLGLAPLALLPLTPARAARAWDAARLVGGLVWLGLLVQIYLGRR